jgi:hypothetical protein
VFRNPALLVDWCYGAATGLRSIVGDLLSIEGLLGVPHSGRVFTCPLTKSCNRSVQRLAEFCEGVFDTHRRLGEDKTRHQATSFQLSQALCEHLLRYTRHTPLQHVEARRSLVVTQCAENEQIPLPGNLIQQYSIYATTYADRFAHVVTSVSPSVQQVRIHTRYIADTFWKDDLRVTLTAEEEEMATEKIRVGIIGANVRNGWGRDAHIPALSALPEFEITAVCTSRQETADETAKHFGIPYAFADPYKMA